MLFLLFRHFYHLPSSSSALPLTPLHNEWVRLRMYLCVCVNCVYILLSHTYNFHLKILQHFTTFHGVHSPSIWFPRIYSKCAENQKFVSCHIFFICNCRFSGYDVFSTVIYSFAIPISLDGGFCCCFCIAVCIFHARKKLHKIHNFFL